MPEPAVTLAHIRQVLMLSEQGEKQKLESLLREAAPVVLRRAAIRGLGRLGCWHPLVEAVLFGPTEAERVEAVTVLARVFGEQALSLLAWLLGDGPSVRLQVVLLLGAMRSAETRRVLWRTVALERHPVVRMACLKGLGAEKYFLKDSDDDRENEVERSAQAA